MTNVTLITYRRGTEKVRSIGTYDHDKDAKTAKVDSVALRGTMEVKGLTFDTLERLDNMVHLPGGQTYDCTMEESTKKVTFVQAGKVYETERRQLRPQGHGVRARKTGKDGKTYYETAAILIHPGSYPHDFFGCIGVGFRTNYGLRASVACFEVLLDLCGGFEPDRLVRLAVEGSMPPR